jgi:predicted RNase H-like HicB family nuclease
MKGSQEKQMRKYFALVEHEKQGAFAVRFPDLPGVFSAADQRADVVVNATEALRLWAEDEALPGPSDHEAIVARDDIREALAAGALLVEVSHP